MVQIRSSTYERTSPLILSTASCFVSALFKRRPCRQPQDCLQGPQGCACAQLSSHRCCCQQAPPIFQLCKAISTLRYSVSCHSQGPQRFLVSRACTKTCGINLTFRCLSMLIISAQTWDMPRFLAYSLAQMVISLSQFQADITIHPMGSKSSHDRLVKFR